MVGAVLKIIREYPLLIGVAVILALFSLQNQPPTPRVYQWEQDSQQLLQRTNQFSDLVQPRKH